MRLCVQTPEKSRVRQILFFVVLSSKNSGVKKLGGFLGGNNFIHIFGESFGFFGVFERERADLCFVI